MHNQRVHDASGHVSFISLFKQADLGQALLVHRNSDVYQSVWRYYLACIGLLDSLRLIEPLTLLKRSLEQLIGVPRVRRDSDSQAEPPKDALSRIYSSIQAFETRLRNSETYAKTAAITVVKNLHFVWLGGGLGAIQHAYLNLWKQVLSATQRIIGVDHHWASEHAEHLPESMQALLETAEHDACIAVESAANSLQWYDVANARLIRVAGEDLPHDYELLGTRHRHVLLHELQEHRVHVYPGDQPIGPFEYVRRDAGVLVVEGQNKVEDLSPLIADDVNCLVLRVGQGAVTYHLSKASWLRLDTVIVDCRHPLGEVPVIPGKLTWALDAPQTLQLSFVDEHLLIVDPDRQHRLILRDVCSVDPAMRGDVFLGFEGGRSHAASSLVQRSREIVEAEGADGSATLAQLLGAVPA